MEVNNDEEHDAGQLDEEEHDEEYDNIKEAILSIIAKIKKDRNRACVQNIHIFVIRRGISIEVDSVKKVLDNLISNNIIVDKGKEGKESFFIVNVPSDSENIKNVENVEIVSNVENVEDDTSLNAIGELIDDKFYSILINRIKSEVKLALDERLNCNIIKEVNTNKDSNTNDILITTLKEEIKFLRDELKSKDQVIKLILQDKVNDHSVKNQFNLEGNSSGTRVHNNNATNISVNKKNDAADKR